MEFYFDRTEAYLECAEKLADIVNEEARYIKQCINALPTADGGEAPDYQKATEIFETMEEDIDNLKQIGDWAKSAFEDL